MMFVLENSRRSCGGRPRRLIVSVSSIPSSRLAAAAWLIDANQSWTFRNSCKRLVVLRHAPGHPQLQRQHPVVLLRQTLLDVAFLVHPAALDQALGPEAADDRLLEGLGPIQDKEIRFIHRQAAGDQIVQQSPADDGVLRRPGPQTQHVFAALAIHAQRHNQREIMEFLAVQKQHAQVQISQRPFEQLLQLLAAGRLPVPRDGTLLDPVARRRPRRAPRHSRAWTPAAESAARPPPAAAADARTPDTAPAESPDPRPSAPAAGATPPCGRRRSRGPRRGPSAWPAVPADACTVRRRSARPPRRSRPSSSADPPGWPSAQSPRPPPGSKGLSGSTIWKEAFPSPTSTVTV